MDISVIRNYLALELQAEGQVFERALDDIIFLSFLGGNDFVPNIELFNIRDNAFGRILQIYKEIMLKSKRFITNSGSVDLV